MEIPYKGKSLVKGHVRSIKHPTHLCPIVSATLSLNSHRPGLRRRCPSGRVRYLRSMPNARTRFQPNAAQIIVCRYTLPNTALRRLTHSEGRRQRTRLRGTLKSDAQALQSCAQLGVQLRAIASPDVRLRSPAGALRGWQRRLQLATLGIISHACAAAPGGGP